MAKSPEKTRYTEEEAFKEGRAIQSAAEEKARQEFYPAPQSRHYETASQQIDYIRKEQPEVVEQIVEMLITGKELKDEMGPELYSIFMQVQHDMANKWQEQSGKELIKCFTTMKIQDKPGVKESLLRMIGESIAKAIKQTRSDDRLIRAFRGKEELLDKAMKLTRQQVMHFFLTLVSSALIKM